MTEESRDNYDNDLIDLTIILDILKNRFKFIIALTIFAASISVYYSLSLPNIYQSTAILSSSSIAKNSNRGIPSFSQLANFSSGSSNELDVMKGVEIIRSYDFFERLTQNNDIFFELMASKGWDASKNEFIIDPEEYNLEKQTWVSTKRFSKNGMPSMQTAHREFRSMLSIVLEKES